MFLKLIVPAKGSAFAATEAQRGRSSGDFHAVRAACTALEGGGAIGWLNLRSTGNWCSM